MPMQGRITGKNGPDDTEFWLKQPAGFSTVTGTELNSVGAGAVICVPLWLTEDAATHWVPKHMLAPSRNPVPWAVTNVPGTPLDGLTDVTDGHGWTETLMDKPWGAVAESKVQAEPAGLALTTMLTLGGVYPLDGGVRLAMPVEMPVFGSGAEGVWLI